jgi:hypothetical protein
VRCEEARSIYLYTVLECRFIISATYWSAALLYQQHMGVPLYYISNVLECQFIISALREQEVASGIPALASSAPVNTYALLPTRPQ